MTVSLEARFHVEDEETPEPCGFDFESFTYGFYCEKPTAKVIILELEKEPEPLHFSHLCDEHAQMVMNKIEEDKKGVGHGPRAT